MFLAIVLFTLAILIPSQIRPILMENIINPKRRTCAEEMGVVSNTIAKPHDVKSIKPQLVKLVIIMIDTRNVAAITSRV